MSYFAKTCVWDLELCGFKAIYNEKSEKYFSSFVFGGVADFTDFLQIFAARKGGSPEPGTIITLCLLLVDVVLVRWTAVL